MAALSLVATGLAVSQIAWAAEGDAWRYEVTPHILTAGLDGTVGIRGVTRDVDMSIGDVLDDFEARFVGLSSARKGPWMYSREAVYLKLEDQGAKKVRSLLHQFVEPAPVPSESRTASPAESQTALRDLGPEQVESSAPCVFRKAFCVDG